MRIEVVQAQPEGYVQQVLELAEGSCVGDALAAVAQQMPADTYVAAAVFGVLARPQQALNEGDRVELLQPLLADPKENRRRRACGGL